MQYFWTNTIWYILLGILTAFELMLIFRKTEKRKFTLAFYFTVTGIILACEVTLFFIFSAYHYYPKIIATSYYDDELAGNLFSQFSIAATAVLICTFNLKFYWNIIFAAAYGLIEAAFLALGIYSQNWYRTWITAAGLIFLFWLIKKDYVKTLKNPGRFLHYINIFFSLITLDAITILWGFILSGYQNYSRELGSNPVASPYLVANLYSYFISVSLMAAYFLKFRKSLKAMVIALLYAVTFMLGQAHILYFKNSWWFLIFSTVYILGVYFSVALMDYLYRVRK